MGRWGRCVLYGRGWSSRNTNECVAFYCRVSGGPWRTAAHGPVNVNLAVGVIATDTQGTHIVTLVVQTRVIDRTLVVVLTRYGDLRRDGRYFWPRGKSQWRSCGGFFDERRGMCRGRHAGNYVVVWTAFCRLSNWRRMHWRRHGGDGGAFFCWVSSGARRAHAGRTMAHRLAVSIKAT